MQLFTAEGTVGVSLTRHGYGTNNQAPLFVDTYNQSTDQHCAKPVCSGSYHDKAGCVMVAADVTHSLRADGFDASEDGTGRGVPLVPVTTLAIRGRGDQSSLEYRTDGTANALVTPNGGRAGIGVGAIQQAMAVRRLLPEECEALQGFRRGYTNIPGAADGPRYKALGNSMAVPVMAWIGRRIKEAYAND
jgi:DNA (cytosine-5)-methyltransferase 1